MNAKLAHGIDLVSIARIREILSKESGPHFEERVFSEGERAYCRGRRDPYPHFAARFAAKEAYGKALGVGLGTSGELIEIETVHDEKGRPMLALHGRAQELFHQHGYREALLSLSHDGDSAIASVILVG